MLWEEDDKSKGDFVIPDDIVDIAYRVNCKQLPTSHAWELSRAIYQALPWLQQEPEVGIHQIHGAASGNGWERPPDGEMIHLSKRSRMHLRVPKQRVDDALALSGETLEIAGNSLEVGDATVKLLNPVSTLFARYVVVPEGADENAFIEWMVAELKARDFHIRKMMCGIGHVIHTPEGDIETRSVMVADLDKPDSIAIQEQGVGQHRHFGCGIFLPHKGIKPVAEADEKTHFSGT